MSMGRYQGLRLMLMLPVGFIAVYTFALGWQTWQSKNKIGAVGVFLLGLISLLLPVWVMFLRKS